MALQQAAQRRVSTVAWGQSCQPARVPPTTQQTHKCATASAEIAQEGMEGTHELFLIKKLSSRADVAAGAH